MLTVHDGEEAAFYGGDDDGCEFRPVKMLRYLRDIVEAPPADVALTLVIDDQLLISIQLSTGAGPGEKSGTGFSKRSALSDFNISELLYCAVMALKDARVREG